MAPTITTQNHTLVSNAEVSFGTIVSPTGFDFIDVFVDGSGNPDADDFIAEWRLYEIVGGLPTLVATAPGGGRAPSVLDWGVGATPVPQPRGVSPAPFSPAEGAGFTFELRAFFSGGPLLPNFTASLIGYDEFDVAANTVSPPIAVVVPANFTEVTLAIVPGYAQFADAVVSQSFNVPIRFTLYAQAGVGGVIAEVASVTLQSSDGIARIFGSPVRLPGATSYMLRARFDSNLLQVAPPGPVTVSGGLATHSQNISVGGVVNLIGNVNGPSNANRWTSLPVPANDADVAIPEVGTVPGDGWWQVGVAGLTATRQVTLPAAPNIGEVVVVTDLDGSLGAQTFNVNGNGNTVEGVAIFAMDNTYPGPNGSVCFVFDQNPATGGFGWFIFADYAPNEGTGNLSETIEAVDRDVLAAEFVPARGLWYVGLSGLTANRTVNIPAMPSGSRVIIKDEDGSLQNWNIILLPAGGKTIDGATPYTMTGAENGIKGSVTLYQNANVPTEWAII